MKSRLELLCVNEKVMTFYVKIPSGLKRFLRKWQKNFREFLPHIVYIALNRFRLHTFVFIYSPTLTRDVQCSHTSPVKEQSARRTCFVSPGGAVVLLTQRT